MFFISWNCVPRCMQQQGDLGWKNEKRRPAFFWRVGRVTSPCPKYDNAHQFLFCSCLRLVALDHCKSNQKVFCSTENSLILRSFFWVQPSPLLLSLYHCQVIYSIVCTAVATVHCSGYLQDDSSASSVSVLPLLSCSRFTDSIIPLLNSS